MASGNTVRRGEIGKSGTISVGGLVYNEEYNWKLTGQRALTEYNKMRRSDATVKASLKIMKEPLLGAELIVDAASQDQLDQDIAGFVEWNFLEHLPWHKVLNDILTMLDFGYSLVEMVFEPQVVDSTQRLVLAKLAFRKQQTISAWETKDHQPGVTQTISTGESFSIPNNKIVVFTNDQEGDSPEGVSVLRSAYKHWYYKELLYKIEAASFEKHGLGVLNIKTPPGASAADISSIEEAAMNMRANESSFIRHPNDYDVSFMEMKSSGLKDPKDAIAHHDRQISKNVLAQFLELGADSGSGSRSLSEDHTRLFEQSLETVTRTIATALQKAVNTLVDLNWDTGSYPRLRFGRIGDEKVTQTATVVAQLVSSGAVNLTEEDERHLRKLAGLPQLPDDDATDETKNKDDKPKPAENLEASLLADAALLRERLTGVLYDEPREAA